MNWGGAVVVAMAAMTAAAVEVDGVVARVGTRAILRSEVLDEMAMRHLPSDRFDEVRNAQIERELILRSAVDAKLSMQEWVVENRIREIITQHFDGDRNKLMAMLTERRISYPEWRQRIKNDMIAAAMRYQMVDRNVTTSPAEMRTEYMKHPERYRQQRRMTVSVILLKPDQADKRQEVTAALKEKSFSEVAMRYSSDSHAAKGGQWADVVPEEVFQPVICAELQKMPRHTMSDWIELDGWFFLLRKDDESTAKSLTFAEAYDQIRDNLRRDRSKELYDEWIERLKHGTYIKVY